MNYTVSYSELFEAGFYRLLAAYPQIDEVLEFLDWSMGRTPLADTEPFSTIIDADLRFLVTPITPRYPSLRVLLELGERRVFLWHISKRVDDQLA